MKNKLLYVLNKLLYAYMENMLNSKKGLQMCITRLIIIQIENRLDSFYRSEMGRIKPTSNPLYWG